MITPYTALPPVLHIKDSPVAGQGIFAKENIPADFALGMSHVVIVGQIIRTPLGGFINHSDTPNCEKWEENQRYYMRTTKPIKKGEELFLCYTFYKVNGTTKNQ